LIKSLVIFMVICYSIGISKFGVLVGRHIGRTLIGRAYRGVSKTWRASTEEK